MGFSIVCLYIRTIGIGMYLYMYINIQHMCMHVYIYIYTYAHTGENCDYNSEMVGYDFGFILGSPFRSWKGCGELILSSHMPSPI